MTMAQRCLDCCAFFARADLYPLPGFNDPFSAMTHLIGGLVFIYLGYRLVRRNWGHPERNGYLVIYALSNVFLMAMSGVYHMMVFGGTARAVMERLDHSAIFTLIAGTFTPALGILLRGTGKWISLILIWSITLAAITLKIIFLREIPEWLGLSVYLVLGWSGAAGTYLIWYRYGWRFLLPLFLGGVCYSIGGIGDFFGWPVIIPHVVEAHEVSHLWVLAGASCFYVFVSQFAGGRIHGELVHRETAVRDVEAVMAQGGVG
jgi:channel protein (hemolysin III family)